jgi:capsular polysaccharide transport system ATP-binding protein
MIWPAVMGLWANRRTPAVAADKGGAAKESKRFHAISDHDHMSPDPDKCIRLNHIVKDYHTQIGTRRVLDGIGFTLNPGEKIGILGRNGAGKSTLVKIIGGVERPTSGEVHRGMSMSWPLTFAGGFEPSMSGMDNIRFISRVYDTPLQYMIDFVDDFAELGSLLYLPVRTYSSGMRMRLAFALTLAVKFDCMLIDEVIAVGDKRFHQRCYDELFIKRADCAMILVSHEVSLVRDYCSKALLLKAGRGQVFHDLEFALKIYETM